MFKLIRYLRVAFVSIIAHKMRAVLTMLGIIIGVTAVLTTVGIGAGAASNITEEIESQGTNLLTVNAGQRGAGSSSSLLTMADAEALADRTVHPDLVNVVPEYTSNATLTNGDSEGSYQVVGTTPAYATVRNLGIESGAFFTAEQLEEHERVVVLGDAVASDLFGADDPVDQAVRIDGSTFTVIGVLEEVGGGPFGSNDDRAYVPIDLAQGLLFSASRYRGSHTVTGISIQATDQLDAAELDVERTLRLRHGLGADDENDFTLFNQASLLDMASSVATTLTVFLGSIGAVSLLVGGIGIMNIMLVSVTERTREIGLRKAVGAHDSDILLQFLVESLVLCVMGGLIGMGLSYSAAYLLGFLSFMPFRVVITGNSLVLALAVSSACGVLFGLYPALRATKLDPIEALRYE